MFQFRIFPNFQDLCGLPILSLEKQFILIGFRKFFSLLLFCFLCAFFCFSSSFHSLLTPFLHPSRFTLIPPSFSAFTVCSIWFHTLFSFWSYSMLTQLFVLFLLFSYYSYSTRKGESSKYACVLMFFCTLGLVFLCTLFRCTCLLEPEIRINLLTFSLPCLKFSSSVFSLFSIVRTLKIDNDKIPSTFITANKSLVCKRKD